MRGTTTNYTWDVVGSLPNVLSDGTLKYVYGLGLAYTMDGANNIQVLHTDGLGSVRAITNSGGSVIQTFQTDEFGVPTLTQGTNTEPFRYTGQQLDPETGFLDLRARYYWPSLGRFVSRDSIQGKLRVPLTLNRYSYALSDPVNLVDPTGLSSSQALDDSEDALLNCADPTRKLQASCILLFLSGLSWSRAFSRISTLRMMAGRVKQTLPLTQIAYALVRIRRVLRSRMAGPSINLQMRFVREASSLRTCRPFDWSSEMVNFLPWTIVDWKPSGDQASQYPTGWHRLKRQRRRSGNLPPGTVAFRSESEVSKLSISDQASSVETREDLVEFLEALGRDFLSNSQAWENITLNSYFDAASRWLDVADAYFANHGEPAPEVPSWKLFAQILAAATIYE